MINVIMYGKTFTFNSNRECFDWAIDGYWGTEGSEQQRYAYTLMMLYADATVIDTDNDM